MTILFRYIGLEFAKLFLMCFSGLMTIYLVIDFFEKLRRFLKFDAQMSDILTFFLLRTPGITFQIAPLAVLMATLLSLGLLSRNHEITAMRSCGVSLGRLAAPFLVIGGVISVLLLGMTSVIIPTATARAEYVKNTFIEKKPQNLALKAARPWLQIRGPALLNVELVEPGGRVLQGVRVYQLGPQFRLTLLTEARQAVHTERGWLLQDGIDRRFLPNGNVTMEPFMEKPLPLSQEPQDFDSWLAVESESLTLRELKAYIDRLSLDGYNFSRVLTDYHGRMAFPFVSVIMVLVGIALSLLKMGTRGTGLAMGIGQAMVVGFFYWMTHSVAIALGRSGVLLPVLAAWMANIMFLSVALYLLLRVRY